MLQGRVQSGAAKVTGSQPVVLGGDLRHGVGVESPTIMVKAAQSIPGTPSGWRSDSFRCAFLVLEAAKRISHESAVTDRK